MGDITVSVVQQAILLSECGTVGDITVRMWYSGQYYCQSVVQWTILLSECGTVGNITVRVWYSGQYYCQGVV